MVSVEQPDYGPIAGPKHVVVMYYIVLFMIQWYYFTDLLCFDCMFMWIYTQFYTLYIYIYSYVYFIS